MRSVGAYMKDKKHIPVHFFSFKVNTLFGHLSHSWFTLTKCDSSDDQGNLPKL